MGKGTSCVADPMYPRCLPVPGSCRPEGLPAGQARTASSDASAAAASATRSVGGGGIALCAAVRAVRAMNASAPTTAASEVTSSTAYSPACLSRRDGMMPRPRHHARAVASVPSVKMNASPFGGGGVLAPESPCSALNTSVTVGTSLPGRSRWITRTARKATAACRAAMRRSARAPWPVRRKPSIRRSSGDEDSAGLASAGDAPTSATSAARMLATSSCVVLAAEYADVRP